MDSIYVHLKLSNLKMVGNVFRVIEVCVFFIALSRVSFQFQFPVGEYAKKFFSLFLSHRFVFVLGNVIVITLFAKSGRDSNPDNNLRPDPTPATDNSCNKPIHKGISVTIQSRPQSSSIPIEGAKYGTERDPRLVPNRSERCNQSGARIKNQNVQGDMPVKIEQHISINKVCFKRSYSECLEVENYAKPRRILRRTVTERCKGVTSGGRCDELEALEGGGDGMSDEDFRIMVETFIAKQQRSLREEGKCLFFS